MSDAKERRGVHGSAARILIIATAVLLATSGVALSSSQGASVPNGNPNQRAIHDAWGGGQTVGLRGTSAPTVRDAVYPESAIISNGTVELGVNPTGNLNVPGGTPSSGTKTTAVGLRYVPTNADATSPGCLCEGWGVADAESPGDPNAGTAGYANVSTDSGSHHLRVVEFENTEDSARSVVDVLGGEDGQTPIMRVTHEYQPFAGSPNLYDATVTVENLTGTPIADLRYRRVMDWDIEPTAFSEYSTIDGDHSSEFLKYSSDDGFASANPLSGPSSILAEGFFTDSGPYDHGALFDFGFGSLPPLESKSFHIFYGAAGDEADAVAAVTAAQAEVWSFGEPSTPDGPTLGTPNTFIFGFSGIGGAGAGTDDRPPATLATSAPNRLPVGDNEFEATARLDNTSASNIADGSVRIDPGPDMTRVSGASPASLGILPAESAGHGPSSSWKLRAPAPACAADHTYEYDIYGDFAGSGSAGGERHVHRSVTVPRTCGTVQGTTTWETLEGSEVLSTGPEPDAQISVCPVSGGGGECRLATSAGDGSFSTAELPAGEYTIEARPNPSGPHADLPPQTKIVHISAGGTVGQSFEFSTLRKPPADGSSSVTTPSVGGTTEDGYPIVYWGDPIHLTTKTTACAHPTVTYAITQGDPVIVTLSSGPMTEGPPGTFTADAPSVYPHHGYSEVTFTIHCPESPDPEPVKFDIYIDPSGVVRNVGGSPVAGATVTLLHSSSVAGPFTAVPDGSTVMSPANRTNPGLTNTAGHFGWDVSAGYYRVRAEKSGCHAPSDSSTGSVETPTYNVPPPVTEIDLRLECASVGSSSSPGRPATGVTRGSGVAVGNAVALVRSGKALLHLRCDGEGACAGVAELVASTGGKGKRVAGRDGRRLKHAPGSVIGKKPFHLSPGKAGVLSIPLNSTGKRLVRKAGRHGVKAELIGDGLTSRTITLKAEVPKRHGKRS